jgi:hypothetical protein
VEWKNMCRKKPKIKVGEFHPAVKGSLLQQCKDERASSKFSLATM